MLGPIVDGVGGEVLILHSLMFLPQVQRGFQVLTECAPGASGTAALLGPADAAQAPQIQPDRRGQVAPEKSHGIPGG